MASAGEATRRALVATAEQLFAKHGVTGVSLNEVTRAAGQRNSSALQYHFGGRKGLLRAILDKHQPGIDEHRAQLLEDLANAGKPSLRDLVEALVLPLARKLDDRDGGPAYLQVMAQLSSGPIGPPGLAHSPGRKRLVGLVADAVPNAPPALAAMRSGLMASTLFHALADHARTSPRARPDQALFLANLIDSLAALLGAPISRQARKLSR